MRYKRQGIWPLISQLKNLASIDVDGKIFGYQLHRNPELIPQLHNWNYTAGGTDPAPLRRGSELNDGRETSPSLSPVGVGVSLASHWLSRELPQHRANQNHRYENSKQYQQFIEQLNRILKL
ncbi:hypothetical protein Taro_024329 [Colocasia esculenta]|uniref:Uncharacterized protein n=1 Tax=Colocasia esculenta TaxID=4460 RepID=A0A843VH66_COLES|nr:hypothetical protein [Colocasia esculenta]